MASFRALLLGIALCGIANAIAQPRIDLTATPAWSGWTRPGRATEVDIHLTTDTATKAALDVVAGKQLVHVDLNLEPGRISRLHLPVDSVGAVAVSVASPAGPSERREVGFALSESALLGVSLVTGDSVHIEGFHTVVLGTDDLPRNASAYSSIDALIVDAPTLGALDQRQLAALLAHAAQCGRIVILNASPGARRVLDGAAGCGGGALMNATSLAEAQESLTSSLAASSAPAMSLPGIDDLVLPSHVVWNRVLVIAAAYFAMAALAVVFFSSVHVFLLLPALATVAVLALLHAMQPLPELVVWSEAESGASSARYQARQRIPGLVRARTRVPALPKLASVRTCDPNLSMRFDYDAGRALTTFVDFDTRLFQQAQICYSGSFPASRAVAIEARPGGSIAIRNAGSTAWPKGVLLVGGFVHELPALAPGDSTTIRTENGKPIRGALQRKAMARTRADGAAALWELESDRLADLANESQGWLLVSVPLS